MWEFLRCILSEMKLLQDRFPHVLVSIKHNLLIGLC